jgi:hypothetical protein
MRQKFTITESERKQIRGLYEQVVPKTNKPIQQQKSKSIQNVGSFGEDIPQSNYSQLGDDLTNPRAEITTKDNKNFILVYDGKYKPYSIVFQANPQLFQQINSTLKQMYNSPDGTQKTFHLGNNSLSTQNSKQTNTLYISITNPQGIGDVMRITSEKDIDDLFPSSSRNVNTQEIRNQQSSQLALSRQKPKTFQITKVENHGVSKTNPKYNGPATGTLIIDYNNNTASVDITFGDENYKGNLQLTRKNLNGQMEFFNCTGKINNWDVEHFDLQLDMKRGSIWFDDKVNYNHGYFVIYYS